MVVLTSQHNHLKFEIEISPCSRSNFGKLMRGTQSAAPNWPKNMRIGGGTLEIKMVVLGGCANFTDVSCSGNCSASLKRKWSWEYSPESRMIFVIESDGEWTKCVLHVKNNDSITSHIRAINEIHHNNRSTKWQVRKLKVKNGRPNYLGKNNRFL